LIRQNIGVDGLKTGHTEAGGYGISISAERKKRRLYVVVNGLESKRERIVEAERLLEFGYRNFETVSLLKSGQRLGQAEVWFGKTNIVSLVVQDEVQKVLPRNWQRNAVARIVYDSPIPAPIQKGQEVAALEITHSKDQVISIPLVAGEEVPALTGFSKLFRVSMYYLTGV